MRPVLAVRSAGVEEIAVGDHRAVRRVVREHAEIIHHVIFPNNVRICRGDFHFRFTGPRHVLAFVFEISVVAVLQAFRVEAQDFATAGHEIQTVAFDYRR